MMNGMDTGGLILNEDGAVVDEHGVLVPKEIDLWYEPKPGRTGNFPGHALPATFMILTSVVYLLLTLYRANLHAREGGGGRSFMQQYVPENNTNLLKRCGGILVACCTVGILVEAIGGKLLHEKHSFFAQLAHENLYLGFGITSLSAVFEGQGRLPLDTHRACCVMAFIASYLIWHSHGVMKQLPADGELHILLSYINLSNAAVMAYSIKFNDSVIAWVASWALLFLQGIWLLTAGSYECCIDLPMHNIATYLASEALVVTVIILVVAALFGPGVSSEPHYNNLQEEEREEIGFLSEHKFEGDEEMNGHMEMNGIHDHKL